MMMGFGIIGLLLMLLFWGVLIIGAILIVRELIPSGQRLEKDESPRTTSASETLDLRYARGEIDREEYELKKVDLSA